MTRKSLLAPSSVILASGGGKGITAQCVIKLAQHARCKFILLGRSSIEGVMPDYAGNGSDDAQLKRRIMEHLQTRGEKPTPQKVQKLFKAVASRKEIEKTLQAIQNAGGQAEYISVDVTNGTALREKLAEPVQRLGAITGIIHGAGSLADKLIEKKTAKDFETVYSPKVKGLENLLACVPVDQLDFLVLFSSIVAFYGNIGQSDYAIANEVMDKSAHIIKRIHPRCRVISINWGPWDAGIVTPELKKTFADHGVALIPVETGANMLVDELSAVSSPPAQVVIGYPPIRPSRGLDPELRCYQIHRRLRLEDNPFLQDHMIGQHAVLPATCGASWIAGACEQLYPGYKAFSLENYKILKGIVFDNSLADEYVLDIKETSKRNHDEVEIEAIIWSKSKRGKELFHYSLQAKLLCEVPVQPGYDLPDVLAYLEDSSIPGSELYENGTLFHGPCFQGVERVFSIDDEKLLMRCNLPEFDERQQGQFIVQTSNPFVNDAVVQSLLVWTQHFYQAPCLPSRMQSIKQFKPLTFGETYYVTLEVQSRTDNAVIGDVTVQDPLGEVMIQISGLEGTISKQLNSLIGIKSSTG